MPKSGGTIYAIGVVGTSWVKIGRTTGPVRKRLQTLQTWQPFPLQVLASIDAGRGATDGRYNHPGDRARLARAD